MCEHLQPLQSVGGDQHSPALKGWVFYAEVFQPSRQPRQCCTQRCCCPAIKQAAAPKLLLLQGWQCRSSRSQYPRKKPSPGCSCRSSHWSFILLSCRLEGS